MKYIAFITVPVFALGFAFAHSAFAQLTVPENNYNLANQVNPTTLLDGVVGYILGFVAVLAMLMIVTAGVMYMTSGGDSGRVDTAKRWLTWGIGGLLVVLLAWVIVNAISAALGAG